MYSSSLTACSLSRRVAKYRLLDVDFDLTSNTANALGGRSDAANRARPARISYE